MGQYHLTVNLDKREFIDPHTLGDGLKLAEQLGSRWGVAQALLVLLAVSNGRGGGDLDNGEELLSHRDYKEISKEEMYQYVTNDYSLVAGDVIGRWGGNRIAVVGDYNEESDLPDDFLFQDVYQLCRVGQNPDDYKDEKVVGEPFTDITSLVIKVLEHELGIKYQGDGWNRISRDPEASWSILPKEEKTPVPATSPDMIINLVKKDESE